MHSLTDIPEWCRDSLVTFFLNVSLQVKLRWGCIGWSGRPGCWTISSSQWIQKHLIQKRTNAARGVRRGFILLENITPWKLLSFWLNISVQDLIVGEPFDSSIRSVVWLYHIIPVPSTPICYILLSYSCSWISLGIYLSKIRVLWAFKNPERWQTYSWKNPTWETGITGPVFHTPMQKWNFLRTILGFHVYINTFLYINI